jgi:hypothetical protein
VVSRSSRLIIEGVPYLEYSVYLRRIGKRTRTAGLLIASELLKSRESDSRCFSLLLVSQHSIHRNPLEAYLWHTVGQQSLEP